ncbi:hypothetical protein CRBSH125_32880 [Afipia carboxidovorans]|nr:hypothetical protein CRBSH125_32880 [Afipia carboxidovorans]
MVVVSMILVMVLILWLGLERSAALQPWPSPRPGGARCKGGRDGGGSPGLHKRIEPMGESLKHASVRKAGETVPVERQRSLAPRQGAAPPSNPTGASESERRE